MKTHIIPPYSIFIFLHILGSFNIFKRLNLIINIIGQEIVRKKLKEEADLEIDIKIEIVIEIKI
jgi:hypothetical protein